MRESVTETVKWRNVYRNPQGVVWSDYWLSSRKAADDDAAYWVGATPSDVRIAVDKSTVIERVERLDIPEAPDA